MGNEVVSTGVCVIIKQQVWYVNHENKLFFKLPLSYELRKVASPAFFCCS